MVSAGAALAAGILLVLRAAQAAAAEPTAEGLRPGMVLDRTNWRLAENLLPPEILNHYQTGGYRNDIVDWPSGQFTWPPDFKAATEANDGQYTTSDAGSVVSSTTGEQPPAILGFPFPSIDPSDPKAGTKIIWNYFYLTWYYGNLHAQSQVNWLGPRTLERRTDQDVNFLYYDGVAVRARLPNPQNFSSQQLIVAEAPAELAGTTALTWRYRDPTKRDSLWSFVPALRRVRAVSPTNRSDGFLGSDLSQDDGPFFDGKPEDFTWTLKGEVDHLRIVDPLSLQGKFDAVWQPAGGWRANWDPALKMVGYQDPAWTGLAWAPLSPALAKRRLWVVEAIPKDKYYLYGRLELYIDKETFQGAWNRKFSQQGELLNTLQVMAYMLLPIQRPTGETDYVQGSNMSYNVAENFKLNRATIAGLKSNPQSALDVQVPYDPSFFDMTTLSRFGK